MNNIIDVSIIESGQTRKDVEKIKISSFIDEIVANQDSLIHSTSAVKFLAHNNVIHQANTDIVFQDKKKLQKIITQVLNNAFKFTKQGYIKLTLELINSSLVITISDTGIGIPPDQFSNIFQKFRQLEEGYQRFYGGSGIGLYIANEYTRILGGTIKVSSILGSGSTFSIQIPLAENPSSSTINLQHENTMNWSNKTFLVVEDIMSNYEVIEAMLKPTKAKLLWTKDGLDAIKTFKATPAIDLALVDINIPLLSGIEVCKTIKKYRPALPVIVQTAYSNSIQNNDFQEIGCNLVIEKPIKRKALIEAIQNLLVK
jgi:CheY-like chemotaxis protein